MDEESRFLWDILSLIDDNIYFILVRLGYIEIVFLKFWKYMFFIVINLRKRE